MMNNSKKDSVKMICDIGELAGLFEDRSNVRGFLNRVVHILSNHMQADVCSIYLYHEENQTLSLEATKGLNPEIVGKVRLSLGDGITGQSLKELRPIREDDGKNNPNFKYISDAGEEQYLAFLAVPILRGLERIGVLVLQHSRAAFFDDNDTKALSAIASQLATSLENAKLLIELHTEEVTIEKYPRKKVKTRDSLKELYKGRGVSPGLASGRAFVLENLGLEEILESDGYLECLEDFDKALQKTEAQLEELQKHMEESYSDVASLIFSAHILMLRDSSFSGVMLEKVKQGVPAYKAVVDVVMSYVKLFAASPNERLREKVQDVKDLGHRLLENLNCEGDSSGDYSGHVVVARELFPSELIKMTAQNAEGLVLFGSGASAHVAILAKSMGLGVVYVEDESIFSLDEHDFLIMDAHQGTLFINPDDKIRTEYSRLMEEERESQKASLACRAKTLTSDGHRIQLLSNINLLSELPIAQEYQAEGVGLYRSEFPFIVRNDFPSEEEQYLVYKKIVDAMEGKEVVLRTLDIGGDKVLSYLPQSRESNPFLGLRAIRFSLKNKGLFLDQLRAMLRSGYGADLRIMFPLISSVDDFLEARDIVDQAIEMLEIEGAEFNHSPKIGAMVELPSAVEVVEELAVEADFLCIGSNDLVQYLLGVDRTNEEVSSLYISHHPAVFRSLNRIMQAGTAQDCPVSICGEVAGDKSMLPFLIGIGMQKISLNPRQIAGVQNYIAELNLESCKNQAEDLLKLGTLKEVNRYLGITS